MPTPKLHTARLRNSVAGAVRRLPPPRDEAALALLRSARDLLRGRGPNRAGKGRPGVADDDIGPPLPAVERFSDDHPWVAPPEVSGMGKVVRSVYDTGAKAPSYDADLIDQLNAEYAEKRIVPKPQRYTSPALASAAQRRILAAHGTVDLRDKKALEIGCGHGLEVWWMANNLGCDAHGVDVRELGTWDELASDNVHFHLTDLALDNPFAPNTFDRIVSYTVLEHVAHPYELLQNAYDALKPGGLAWIHANLYAGPQASHRYRDLYFPWPHLLFSDDVIKEWDARHGRSTEGAAWVNRLTWDHYRRYFVEIGFRTRSLTFWEAQWDQEFFDRFENILGRFPKEDLVRDYFVVVLEKPSTLS